MKSRKAITVILSATLICAGGINHARAAVVTTQQALALDQRQGPMAIVQAALAREKEIKKWRREEKKSLIETANPRWEDLSEDWYEN